MEVPEPKRVEKLMFKVYLPTVDAIEDEGDLVEMMRILAAEEPERPLLPPERDARDLVRTVALEEMAEPGRIMPFATLENAGYRQLGHLWRPEGFWQLVRRGKWGAMERTGFAQPGPEAMLGDEVSLR